VERAKAITRQLSPPASSMPESSTRLMIIGGLR
jgi:hypothetical protein